MDAVTRLANDTWEALFRAQATLAREFEFEGDWGGLPTREYGVLYALAGAGEGVRITDLMGDALLTQAGVSRLVARLEKRGLVARRADPSDARACRIVLTPEGHDVQRRVGRHARTPCQHCDDPSAQSRPARDPPRSESGTDRGVPHARRPGTDDHSRDLRSHHQADQKVNPMSDSQNSPGRELEFGLDTFGDVPEDDSGDAACPTPRAIRQVVDEAVLADELGVDVIALGEHHRPEYSISTPETVLAGIATRTDADPARPPA